MIFTQTQIEKILRILDYHFSFVISTNFGIEALDKSDLAVLSSFGVKISDFKKGLTWYDKMYIFGKLSSILKDKQVKTLKFNDFEEYIKRGQYIPLSSLEKSQLEIAKRKTYIHLKGLKERAKNSVNSIILEQETKRRKDYEKAVKEGIERGIVDRKSVSAVVSDIGHKMDEWKHDWGRIVETEMNNIFQEGRAEQMKQFEDDPEVYKIPLPDACFPIEDTEYMTNEGFKLLKNIRGDEKVMSFNLKTNLCEWANINRIIKYPYSGEMHHYRNKNLDLLSTPNHFHLVNQREKFKHGNNRSNVLMPSLDMRSLTEDDYMYWASDGWEGYKDEKITVCGKTFETLIFAQFMGWWLSDGHICFRRPKIKQGGSNMTQIVITQVKEHNFEEIINVFKKMFPDRNLLRNQEQFKMNLDKSYDDLAKWFLKLGKAITKYIPEEILKLDKIYLDEFLIAYRKGDGNKQKTYLNKEGKEIGGRINFYTSSKQMADDLSQVILKCGYNPGYSTRNTIGVTTFKKDGKKITTRHLRYIVAINKRKKLKNVNKYFNVIDDWSGEVGCLELDKNFTLFIRRSGISIWTGNCKHCIRLWLTHGIGSKPIVFKLSTLEANGTNVGRKVADWKPVVGSIHPFSITDKKTPILTDNGWKQIQEIEIGDLVLTHKGRFKKVINTLKHYPCPYKEKDHKFIYTIYYRHLNKKDPDNIVVLNFTGDHKILTQRGWIMVKDLTVKDRLVKLMKKCVICDNYIESYNNNSKSACSKECSNKYRSQNTYKQWNKYTDEDLKDLKVKIGEKVKQNWDEGVYVNTLNNLKSKKNRDKTSKRMLNGGAQKAIEAQNGRVTSKIQLKLYEMVLRLFPDAELEYKIFNRSLDIALPKYKIDIEFDGSYWHIGREEEDKKRNELLKSNGWHVIRYTDKLPKLGKLRLDLETIIQNHEHKYKFEETEILFIKKNFSNKGVKLYDLTVEEDESFIARGVVVHNCRETLTRKPKGYVWNQETQDFEVPKTSTKDYVRGRSRVKVTVGDKVFEN